MKIDLTLDEIKEIIKCIEISDTEYDCDSSDLIDKIMEQIKDAK